MNLAVVNQSQHGHFGCFWSPADSRQVTWQFTMVQVGVSFSCFCLSLSLSCLASLFACLLFLLSLLVFSLLALRCLPPFSFFSFLSFSPPCFFLFILSVSFFLPSLSFRFSLPSLFSSLLFSSNRLLSQQQRKVNKDRKTNRKK